MPPSSASPVRAPVSTMNTPDLVASSGPSPQLQRLRTPDEELPAFDLGAAALPQSPKLPDAWAHRGASATYRKLPTLSKLSNKGSNVIAENTKASFLEACKQGADGIETGESLSLGSLGWS